MPLRSGFDLGIIGWEGDFDVERVGMGRIVCCRVVRSTSPELVYEPQWDRGGKESMGSGLMVVGVVRIEVLYGSYSGEGGD